jgi:hypothetical protein
VFSVCGASEEPNKKSTDNVAINTKLESDLATFNLMTENESTIISSCVPAWMPPV